MWNQTKQRQSQQSPKELDYSLHWAFEYVERGLSVIPLRGKQPALRLWKPFQSRLPDTQELRGWFGPTANERFNLGIVTGAVSGLVVADADCGVEAKRWEKAHPTNWIAKSGGANGGKHFFYRVPHDSLIPNRVRLGGVPIDVRGEGGVICVAPSRHPETGNQYEWLTDFSSTPIDDLPEFQPSWIGSVNQTSNKPSQRQTPQASGPIRNVFAYIKSIHSVANSGGHNSCFRVASLLASSGISRDKALEAIVNVERDKCRTTLVGKRAHSQN